MKKSSHSMNTYKFPVWIAVCNALLIVSLIISRADFNGALPTSALTEGSVIYCILTVFQIGTMVLAFIPYGFIFSVWGIVRHKKLYDNQGLLAFICVLLVAFLITLGIKFFFMIILAGEILFPDGLHF